MEFGVPREIRDLEKRVGLTPAGVVELIKGGHKVYVERNAGADASFFDEHYERAGARIVYTPEEAWGRADVVLKVARPVQTEHRLFGNGQTLISFLHLTVASPDLHAALAEHEITALAYEVMEDEDGTLPVLMPMSEAAGRLAPIFAGRLLTTPRGGPGILLSGLPGVARGIVVIVGAGTLGRAAARGFVGIGAQVIVLDIDVKKLRTVDADVWRQGQHDDGQRLQPEPRGGLCRRPGRRGAASRPTRARSDHARDGAPHAPRIGHHGLFHRPWRLRRDQPPMTLRDPTFVAEGVTHFCVPNLPAAVARTASHALTNAALPYILEIGACGVECAMLKHPALRKGTKMYQGKVTSHRLAAALGREVEIDLDAVLNDFVQRERNGQ